MKNILKSIKSVLRGFDNKLNQIENRIEKSISDAVKTMTGASDTKDGKSGIVPAPKAGQQNLPLCGDGQYKMLPQADYTQNDSTKPDYIKNRPGGYLGEQKTYKLDISAVKQDGIDELTNVSVLQDDFMHMSSINVEISHSSGTINRTLTQREIGPYIINEYGAQIYGNAHLISPSQPDTGEDMALYKEMDSQSNYSIGWHVWATSVPSGDVEVCVVEKTRSAVRFDPEFIPWYASPTANSVLYTAQSLTEEQKAQARANIGAGTPYTLPEASPDALGGVKADAVEAADTQPVRIGTDGKLYTAPGGGGADISLGISGATAGQMAKVKTVDASGAPTAWEAWDDALPLLYHGKVSQEISGFEITEIGGNPMSLSEVNVRAVFKVSTASWCGIELCTSAKNPANKLVTAEGGYVHATAEKYYLVAAHGKISNGNFEISAVQPTQFTPYLNTSSGIKNVASIKSISNFVYNNPPALQEMNAENGRINTVKIGGNLSELEVIIWGR